MSRTELQLFTIYSILMTEMEGRYGVNKEAASSREARKIDVQKKSKISQLGKKNAK